MHERTTGRVQFNHDLYNPRGKLFSTNRSNHCIHYKFRRHAWLDCSYRRPELQYSVQIKQRLLVDIDNIKYNFKNNFRPDFFLSLCMAGSDGMQWGNLGMDCLRKFYHAGANMFNTYRHVNHLCYIFGGNIKLDRCDRRTQL